MYFYKKSMYKISLALDKLLLQLYICFRDGLRSKGTMLLQIGKEGKFEFPSCRTRHSQCVFLACRYPHDRVSNLSYFQIRCSQR